METSLLARQAVAEFLGAFALIFIGAGAVVTPGTETVGIALAHGLVIAAFVTGFGHISGGHFNPAVSIAMFFTRRLGLDALIAYVVAQLLGALAGAALLSRVLPEAYTSPTHLGTPVLHPAISPSQGILIEATMAFFLVLVIFGAAVDGRATFRAVAGLAIGLTITFDIIMGGFWTGAAINPARAFGPAFVSGHWADQAVYWVGPILGAIIAAVIYDMVFLQSRKPAKSAP